MYVSNSISMRKLTVKQKFMQFKFHPWEFYRYVGVIVIRLSMKHRDFNFIFRVVV